MLKVNIPRLFVVKLISLSLSVLCEMRMESSMGVKRIAVFDAAVNVAGVEDFRKHEA